MLISMKKQTNLCRIYPIHSIFSCQVAIKKALR